MHRIWNTCEVVTFESLKSVPFLNRLSCIKEKKNRLVTIPGPREVDLRLQVVQCGKKIMIHLFFVTSSTCCIGIDKHVGLVGYCYFEGGKDIFLTKEPRL